MNLRVTATCEGGSPEPNEPPLDPPLMQATAGSTVMETRIYQILPKIDSYIVILQFFSQGRDKIFSCGFHHNMCPSSG